MVRKGTFSLNTLKRSIHKYLKSSPRDASEPYRDEIRKPDGLSVTEMFDPYLFQSGSYCLRPETYPLKPAIMGDNHCQHCALCGPAGSVQPSCYFSSMLRCITHGWHPPCNYAAITPKYATHGNYPSVALFQTSAAKEFQDMVTHQVVIPCSLQRPVLVNPLGAILKNSDKMRAKVLVGITIIDQATLTAASDALVAAGHPKIKVRMTTDLSAKGVNAASYSPPFRYPSNADTLRIIKRNGFIASGDVSRYFHSFPLAIDGRRYWVIEFGGNYWAYSRCCFGHAACPYYCSTWSAEFRQWALARELDPAFMVDDWLLCEGTLEAAKQSLHTLCEMFEKCGFSMSIDKFQYGQQVVFIGVLIDTVTMTMRFDSVQARGMRLQLEAYLAQISAGRHLDHSTIRHVCGKLNWYAEIVQSGRVHIKSWWDYERNGSNLYSASLLRLGQDTQWWIDLLRTWEEHASGQVEYKILSVEELQNNPQSMYILQSDASGTDGFGYYGSYLHDKEPVYTSKRWNPPLDPSVSSHAFELMALDDFLRNECTVVDAVLVWLSDNESATWSINKGRCRAPADQPVVASVLHQCDRLRLQIVAMWVPREHNELADYLSHLAVVMNRDVVQGKVSELSQRTSSA